MTGAARVMAAAVLTVITSGCATTETVMMQHPRTHEIAQCAEGYRRFIGGDGYRNQKGCIADYERQGYERALAPAGKK
jgi:hypothetical protein